MSDRPTISLATAAELAAALELVSAAGLPVDTPATGRETRLVARAAGRLAGTITLERYGDVGLLRSLAVAPDSRCGGLGTRLCRALFERAAEAGVERLFLLTEDAAPFFARLGFVEHDRAALPADVRSSPQLTSVACGAATCMAVDVEETVALQDRYPGNCFGCGPANEHGLQLRSYRAGDEYAARFRPRPEHNAGPEAWLNGGIVATLIDCHSVFAALADAYRREGRPFASAPLLWCVTGSLSVRYRRPAPITAEVELVARVRETAGRRTTVACTLSSGGDVCATAEVVAVRVGEDWKTPRPSR